MFDSSSDFSNRSCEIERVTLVIKKRDSLCCSYGTFECAAVTVLPVVIEPHLIGFLHDEPLPQMQVMFLLKTRGIVWPGRYDVDKPALAKFLCEFLSPFNI